jgi:hypothetical protein
VFDAAGREIWSLNLDRKVRFAGIWELGILGDGTVLAVTDQLHALHRIGSEGQQTWKSRLRMPGLPGGLSYSKDGSTIAIRVGWCGLEVFDGDGHSLWTRKSGAGGSVASVAVSPEGSHIGVGTWSGSVEVFDRKGSKTWSRKLGRSLFFPSVQALHFGLDGRQLIAGSRDGRFAAFDHQGRQLWTIPYPGWWKRTSFTQISGIPGTTLLMLGTFSGKVIAVDAGGAVKWSAKILGIYSESSASEGGSVIVAWGQGKSIHAFDSSGSFLWKRGCGLQTHSACVSPLGERVAVGSEDDWTGGGSLTMLDRTGKTLWKKPLGKWGYRTVFNPKGTRVLVGCLEFARIDD